MHGDWEALAMKITTIGWHAMDGSGRSAFMVKMEKDVYELDMYQGEKMVRRIKATRNEAQLLAGLWCDAGRKEQ